MERPLGRTIEHREWFAGLPWNRGAVDILVNKERDVHDDETGK
jgi:hypothetical protein